STTSEEESGTRFTQTRTFAISAHPLVGRVEQRARVYRPADARLELLHVRHGELVADARLLRREVGQQHVLAQRGRRARGGDVGVVAVAVGEGAAVAGQDGLAAEHVAAHARRRGVVLDGERAEHRPRSLLALREVLLATGE